MAKRARLTPDNDPLTPTDAVLAGLEKLSKSTGQQSNNSESQQVDTLTSYKDNKTTPSGAVKVSLKKATFQLKQELLEELDRFHLQLQLELGKGNAPYKEIIVEEAIAQLLFKGENNRQELVDMLKKRQSQR